MPDSSPFGLKCVDNGALYVKNDTSAYLGCCTSDPATTDDGICPQGDIRPMTFNKTTYNDIKPQLCAQGKTQWWSCRDNIPPFLGCCKDNPCSPTGCPASKLGAASLSNNAKDAASFLEGAGKSSAAVSASKSAEPSATSTATPTASASGGGGGGHGSHPGVTAGIAVGAAVGVVAVVLVVIWWMRRRRAQAKQAVVGAGDAPFSPATVCGTPSTPAWLLSPASGHSPMVSDYQKCPAGPGSPVPPDYYTVATGKQTVEATELPGNVCFELAADDGRPPPPKKQ